MASGHSGGHEAKSPNCRKTRTYTEACAARNFRCEIGHLIPGVAVQRCFPRTESPLFQIKLNNRLTESHVFHDLNHCGDVVHLTRLIRVNTDIGSGKNLQQLPVGDPSRKVYELLEA